MKSNLEIEEEEKQPLLNNAEAVTVQQELSSIHKGNLNESELNKPSDDNLTSEAEGEGEGAAAAGLSILISNGRSQTHPTSDDSIEETKTDLQEDLNLNGDVKQESVIQQANEAHPGAVAAIWLFLCLVSAVIFTTLLACAIIEILIPPSSSRVVRCPSIKGAWILVPIFGCVLGSCMLRIILFMVKWMKEWSLRNSVVVDIVKVIVIFVLAMWAALHSRDYHQNKPDLLTASWETGLPLSLGVVLSSMLGLMLQGDIRTIFEVMVSGLQVYTVLWISYNRIEAYFLFLAFLFVCAAYYWSGSIIHRACLLWKYIESCVTHRYHILHDTITKAWQGTVPDESAFSEEFSSISSST